MKKKLISVLLSAAMATTMLAGCGSTAADTGAAPAETKATEEKTEAADTEAETDTKEAAATGEGKVYYLNFKPEQAVSCDTKALRTGDHCSVHYPRPRIASRSCGAAVIGVSE